MGTTADLVGREPEMAELETLLAEAADGRERVALVCGDPGIGKTALIDALATKASDAGFRTVWGRCWEGSGTPSYWPWRQVLHGCTDGADVDHFGASETTSPSDDDRSRLFDQVAQRIIAATGKGLLIALDDLHAADEGSLQLLRFLVRADAAVPLLVVGTYRVGEVARSAPHQTAISAVGRYGPTIRLRGLDGDQVEVLLRRVGAEVDRQGATDVHRITDGNPFLVYQAARLLGDRPAATLPADAGAMVGARLDGIAPELRRLLTTAAVIGREFSLALLGRVENRPADDLLDLLGAAQRLFLVDEVGLGRWSFSHALVRETLLDEVGDDERTALHRRVGSVLERIDGAGPTAIAEIAHHLAEGHDPGAAEACASAAAEALAAYAFEDAAHWFRRALDRLPPSEEHRRYELLLALGRALLSVGAEVEAKEAHHQAIRVARSLGSVELAAEAAVRIAPFSQSDATVIGALDDALCDLPEEDSPLRARVLVSFASVLLSSSVDRRVLRQVSRQGRDMARRLGDPDSLWGVLRQWHQDARGNAEILDERLEVASELLAMAEQRGDPEQVVVARQARADVLFEAGRTLQARADAEVCLDMAATLRRPRSTLSALTLLAGVALVQGRIEEAEDLSDRAAEVSRHCDVEWETGTSQALVALRRHQGRLEEVERIGREAMERWTVAGLDCVRQIPRIIALAELGRVDEAATLLETLVGDHPVELTFGMIVPDVGWVASPKLCCPTALAEACCLLGDRTRAAPLYEALLPSAERHVVVPRELRGVVARYLGQVAALLGRYDEAEAHFRLAHRVHDSTDMPIWSAHGRLDHGRMLLARNGPGDHQRAGELLAEARDRFDAMGMEFYRQRAADLLRRARRTSATASIGQEDGHWTFTYGGGQARLRDSKGVRFLVQLLRAPGRELHALDLTTADPDRERARVAPAHIDGLSQGTGSNEDAGAAKEVERARQSVTRALKATVDRLDDAHPALGTHLRSTLRIGVYSTYVPDPRAPTRWDG